MSQKRFRNSLLIMIMFTMITALSAISAMADSCVKITSPKSGDTLKPSKIDVSVRFAQPPGIGSLAIVGDASTSYVENHYNVKYTPVKITVYKDGKYLTEKSLSPSTINFSSSGKKITDVLLDEEGTYTIKASAPYTQNESDSVTFTVKGEYDGIEYSNQSANSTNAPVLTEGVSQRCTLTPSNNFMTTFTLKPGKTGRYLFFTSGYEKQIQCTLYKGVGDTKSLDYVDYEDDDKGTLCLSADLEAGTPYTLLVQGYVKRTNTVFDVGYMGAGKGAFLQSAKEITLTDTCMSYTLGVCSDSEIPESADWVISDRSIVNSFASSSFSVGQPTYEKYLNGCTIRLEAVKDGNATVKLADKTTGKVYASCNVTCRNIPVTQSDGQKGDGSDKTSGGSSNGNASSGSGTGNGATAIQERITINQVPGSVKVKATKNKVTVSWKKLNKKSKAGKKLLKKINGIEVQIATNTKFTKNLVKVKAGKTKAKITKKLKRKRTYYVRLRYVGKDGGFSNWTKTKQIKIK